MSFKDKLHLMYCRIYNKYMRKLQERRMRKLETKYTIEEEKLLEDSIAYYESSYHLDAE